ncbi:unnamed protein product [Lactuca virosa]|uniref:Uncharacterized protein n=1 Tax=Lactuca virosa TaxID=75947 RepID=A0AAU9MMD7_9ASTR|nr:unnamed protein product [Lactuca virosa]
MKSNILYLLLKKCNGKAHAIYDNRNSRKSRSKIPEISIQLHSLTTHKLFAFLPVVYRRLLLGNPNDLNPTGCIISVDSPRSTNGLVINVAELIEVSESQSHS